MECFNPTSLLKQNLNNDIFVDFFLQRGSRKNKFNGDSVNFTRPLVTFSIKEHNLLTRRSLCNLE